MKTLTCLMAALVIFTSKSGWASTFYVNNVDGDDRADGRAAEVSRASGPFKTLAKGLSALQPGGRLEIINTGVPYNEKMHFKVGGNEGAPIVIDGNGAVIDLGMCLESANWKQHGKGWILEGVSALNHGADPDQRAAAFWNEHALRIEAGGQVPQLPYIAINTEKDRYVFYFQGDAEPPFEGLVLLRPPLSSAVAINGQSNIHIIDLWVRHAGNDGFNIHGREADNKKSRNILLERVIAERNGDEGISVHGDGEVRVVDSVVIENGSAHGGIADVHDSETVYINTIAMRNSGAGFFFNGKQHSAENCMSLGNANADFPRPASLRDSVTYSSHTESGESFWADEVHERLATHPAFQTYSTGQ